MRSMMAALVLLGWSASGLAWGQACEQTIEGNDAMRFNLTEVRVSADCGTATITLKHVGQFPVNAMGHNFVLSATSDYTALATDALQAGAPNYLPEDDPRVLGATAMIGGGEESSVTIDLSGLEAGGDYTFMCTFPGHYVVMNGKFIIE